MYPFLLHSLSMSVFSSVIGPFGGFFASGFKRAFKIKVWSLTCVCVHRRRCIFQQIHFPSLRRTLVIWFPAMVASWIVSIVNFWWPHSSTSTFPASFEPHHQLNFFNRYVCQLYSIVRFPTKRQINCFHFRLKFQIYNLKPEQQLQLYNSLRDSLHNRSILD